MAKLIEASGYMTDGEERAAKHLQQLLPDNWLIVANKMVTRPNKSLQEIDLIILGEHRLFIIDEKGFAGRIHGDDVRWYTNSREAFTNPIGKTEVAAKIVAGKLYSEIPELREISAQERVLALILLSNDSAKFLAQGENQWRVLALAKAAVELQRLDKQGTYSLLKPYRARIESALLGLRERPPLPHRINTYEILEELDSGVHYRTLLAKHDRGELRRLKLYFLGDLSQSEQSEQSNLLYRDYDALQRAAQVQLALPCESPFEWSEHNYLVFPHHTTEMPSFGAWSSERSEELPLRESVALINALLSSLQQLHDLGILHRNLHPGSIHVELNRNAEWQVIFSDFDFARLPETQSIALRADVLLAESPYRAPEVCLSLAQATICSDLYSVGVLLAELLSGSTAHEMRDENSGQITIPLLSRLPQPLEAEANDLREILKSMTHSEPSKRWGSAHEVLDIVTESFAQFLKIADARVNDFPSKLPVSSGIYEEGMLLDDQYKILRRLGSGATADTYLAFDIMAEKQCVLKKLKEPEFASLLARREYQALSKLKHPNIVRVIHLFPPNASFHVLMEYVPGMALSALRETFPWKQDVLLLLAEQVLSALEELENVQIIHGDLSPNNILWNEGTAHLIDFGSAAHRTKPEQISAATLAYCAPEVQRGLEPPQTADLYAFGVILYELLLGMSPFERDENGVLSKNRLRSLPLRPDTDLVAYRVEAMLNVCLKACAFEPHERFARACNFRDALLHASRVVPSPVREETAPRVVNEWVTAMGEHIVIHVLATAIIAV